MNNLQTHIRPLFPTRFTCKYNASSGLRKQLLFVTGALEAIEAESSDKIISLKAYGFLHRQAAFDTIFDLCAVLPLFELIENVLKLTYDNLTIKN